MKKILILTALLTGVCTFAQEVNEGEKLILKSGTFSLGGNLNFGTSSQDFSSESSQSVDKNTFFRIQPRFGYFIVNNFEIGIALDYTQSVANILVQTQPVTDQDNIRSTFGVIPYVRGYKSINKKLLLFVQGEAGYNFFKSELEINSSNLNTLTIDTFELGVKPGITYFISKRMALEASLGGLTYGNSNRDFESRNPDNTFNEIKNSSNAFNFSINPSDFLFGLSFYF